MLIDIHLGENKEYSLTYELFDNRVARRIWERYQEIDFTYLDQKQFYNFTEDEEQVKQKLNESIENIKRLSPGIFTDADDLNSLHVNFPDLVKDAEGELSYWLSMFNYHVHYYEDVTRFKTKRFLSTTIDNGEPLEDEDYNLFSPTRLTNHLYMNYPHVGKHIMELWIDKDTDIPADHIVPTSILKNDVVAWFAPNQCTENPKRVVKNIKRWCVQIADKLPYQLDDKRLAIGHIPLGKLTHEPDLNLIAKYQYFNSVTAY